MNYLYILIGGFVLFVFSLIVHILIWRYKRLQSPRFIFVILFFVVPLLIVLSLYYLPHYWSPGQNLLGITLSEGLAVYLLHGALSGGYFFLYPTAQDGSPAVRLSLYLQAHMPQGLTIVEMNEYLMSNDDIHPRINDLIVSGYLRSSESGTLHLTLIGNIIIWPFIMFRQLLGLKDGEG